VLTTFDTDLENWSVTGDNTMTWNGSGGNPGGCLSVNDLSSGPINVAVAPKEFLGDWSLLGPGDTLAVDLFLQPIAGDSLPSPFLFRLVGPGGSAHAPIGTSFYPSENLWTRYAVSLSPGDWTLESGTWAGILATVQTLYVAAEFVNGTEDCRIDNVYLSQTPVPLTSPCLASTFSGTDTEDWSFANTATVAFSATGGNAGGYVQVTDGTGTSQAIAPSSFDGDWSTFDGVGTLRVDLRLLSASGNAIGAADFVTLSGPGGAARHSLAAAEIPPIGPLWKTFEIAIEAGAWTLTSGTWSGLLADVGDVRMTLDFYDGNEVVAFDNFGRFEDGCPDPDLHLTLDAADLVLCTHVSMEGLRGVARDPAGGEIYGVIDLAPGYGGLWGVTGPESGVLLQSYIQPAHLVFDPAGNAYVSENNSGNVYRRAAAGGSQLWVSGFHSGDDDPFGLCVAPAGFDGPAVDPGDVVVADHGFLGPDEIWAFPTAAPEGEQLLLADPGEVDFYDLAPGDGTVYVCDALDANALQVVSPDGSSSDLILSSPIPDAISVVRDPDLEQLYVASGSADAVYRVTISSGAVESVASGFLSLAHGCLEFDDQSRALWITDQGANRVHRLCSTAPVDAGQLVTGRSATELVVAPNPSRGASTIHWTLAAPSHAVSVRVVDVAGRRMRTLAYGPLPAGSHERVWDGTNDGGHPVTAGIYFVVLDTERDRARQKVLVLR
jgi:hypothetical protein